MDYIIAVAIWLVLGELFGFVAGIFIAAKGKCDAILWPIAASITRMVGIIYLIRMTTDFRMEHIIYPAISAADIALNLIAVSWWGQKYPVGWRPECNPTMYRIGATVGSLIFSIYYLSDIYLF